MQDEDENKARSPSTDLNEYQRLKLERSTESIGHEQNRNTDSQKLTDYDILKAQKRLKNTQERPPSSESEGIAEQTTYQNQGRVSPQKIPSLSKVPVIQQKISNTSAFFLIGTALLTDVLQFVIGLIPVVGQIVNFLITLFATCTFWLWFKLLNVKFSRKQNIGRLTGIIIEYIPIISMLPSWTLTISLLIWRQNKPEAFSMQKILKK